MAEHNIKSISQFIEIRFAIEKFNDIVKLIFMPTNKVDITKNNFKCSGKIISLKMEKSGFSLLASSKNEINFEIKDGKIIGIDEEIF